MTTVPEEALKAACDAYKLEDDHLSGIGLIRALEAALPHLPGVGVKKLKWRQEENGDYIAESAIGWYHIGLPHRMWNLTKPNGEVPSFWMLEDAKDAAQADYEARVLSALEPSAADMGNPITDKTVKMALAEAIAQVWYQTRDCDVEDIDRIIDHLNRNGLLIVGSHRFRMMAEAIQSAAAYLALSQPNSAEKLIAELDAALNCETVRVDQLSGNSGQLIESLIKDADWLGEYGYQLHEECEYHDGGFTANRLQAIGDRISKLIKTGITVSDGVDSTEAILEPSEARGLALEEALRKMVALYESEYDADVPFKRPDWLVAALSSPDHADAGKVEGDGWLPIETAPRDRTSVIIAVPAKEKKDGFIVGEAYFDPENYEGGDWWWAGSSHTDHFDSPISELNYNAPTHWRPLPSAPSQEVA